MNTIQATETRQQYIARKKKIYKMHCEKEGIIIDIQTWKELVLQWNFDYTMERFGGVPLEI